MSGGNQVYVRLRKKTEKEEKKNYLDLERKQL